MSDMTIRTDFEDWLKDAARPGAHLCFDIQENGQYLDSLIQAMYEPFMAAHALYAPRWIPLSERLPEVGQTVVVLWPDRTQGILKIRAVPTVFHDWMPLPSTEGLE